MKSVRNIREMYNDGVKLHQSGEIESAILIYENVLSLEVCDPVVNKNSLNNLAAANLELGNLKKSEEIYRKYLHQYPDDVGAMQGLAVAVKHQHRFREAASILKDALVLQPQSSAILEDIGICLTMSGEMPEAERFLLEARKLRPNKSSIPYNLGRLYRKHERYTEALSAFDAALDIEPGNTNILLNRGLTFDDLDRLNEAIDDLRSALNNSTDDDNIKWSLAVFLLLDGQYKEAWPLFDSRWEGNSNLKTGIRKFSQPQWQGAAEPDGTLLIHSEQGFGDFLQVCRYIPEALNLYQGQVLVEVQPELTRLISCSFKHERLRVVNRAADFPGGTGLPDFTCHLPAMSLLSIFRPSPPTPASKPYLHADEALVSEWKEKVRSFTPRGYLRCGIVWRGNPRHHNDHNRSIPHDMVLPLLQVPNVAWFIMQPPSNEGALSPHVGMPNVYDIGSQFTDFADTAAAMKNMDIIITVDTAVAHLAGALKRPVWILLGPQNEWRWLRGTKSTQWYASATLFRRQVGEGWSTVIASTAQRLRTLIPS